MHKEMGDEVEFRLSDDEQERFDQICDLLEHMTNSHVSYGVYGVCQNPSISTLQINIVQKLLQHIDSPSPIYYSCHDGQTYVLSLQTTEREKALKLKYSLIDTSKKKEKSLMTKRKREEEE